VTSTSTGIKLASADNNIGINKYNSANNAVVPNSTRTFRTAMGSPGKGRCVSRQVAPPPGLMPIEVDQASRQLMDFLVPIGNTSASTLIIPGDQTDESIENDHE
jgi:hypothetical protein